MEDEQLLLGLGVMGASMAVLILGVLAIIMPWSVYSAQKWAHRCFKELEKMNRRLERMEKRGP